MSDKFESRNMPALRASMVRLSNRRLLRLFRDEVNIRAEDNMLKTGKLEGSHHAAMMQLLKELGI